MLRIPNSGVLLLAISPRKPGWRKLTLVEGGCDGGRREIPWAPPLDPMKKQVVAIADGAAGMIDGSAIAPVEYQRYIVGVPGEMPGWGRAVQELERSAVREVVKLRSTGRRP